MGLPQNSEASLIGSMEIQRDATYLTLFVTVLPALNPPEPFKVRSRYYFVFCRLHLIILILIVFTFF